MNCKLASDQIVAWLRNVKEQTHTKGFIVGLSGGIDSAVVANLIYQADKDNSMAVILPCDSNSSDESDAKAVAEAIGIKCAKVDLSHTRKMMLDEICLEEPQIREVQMAVGNLGARLRMSAIYTIANGYGYLVVGTDNKAEIYTGYFTKYGDGGVDIMPISHLLKREVYELARYFKVPESVIDKKPSAGFFADQTDEGEMGVSYDTLDDMLSGVTIPKEDQDRLNYLHNISEHKRNTPLMFSEIK